MTQKRIFGRLYVPDQRDEDYLIMTDLGEVAYALASSRVLKDTARIRRGWWVAQILNQGILPACVGFAGFGWLQAGAIRNLQLPFTPYELYRHAQDYDEWEGSDYEGTSVRGLFKYLQYAGYVSEYRWTWQAEVLAATVLLRHPVVVGTNWYTGMMNPTLGGYVKPTGDVEGGHAYLISRVQMDKRRFGIVNSWGEDWGRDGRAWIKFDDMQRLLSESGEACLGIEVLR